MTAGSVPDSGTELLSVKIDHVTSSEYYRTHDQLERVVAGALIVVVVLFVVFYLF